MYVKCRACFIMVFFNPALPNTDGSGQWTEGDPFTGVQSDRYWSSTTYAGDMVGAWYVYLSYGSVGYGAKIFTRGRVARPWRTMKMMRFFDSLAHLALDGGCRGLCPAAGIF